MKFQARQLASILVFVCLIVMTGCNSPSTELPTVEFTLEEATIADIQTAFDTAAASPLTTTLLPI